MSAPINVWLDCDPGHDDAFAIILAGNNDKIKLLGISTVAGNQTVERTTINALRISSISGMESVPVAKGLAKPLMRKSRICPEIHGTSGLDGTNFPELTKKVVSEKAPLYIHDVVTKLPKDEKLTIVATACLTNIALFITLFPEDKERIENIYLLGGSVGVGNITPSAEFNILVDPEAARIVYESGIPIYMVPIDVSHTVLATPEICARFEAFNSNYGNLLVELLRFFTNSYKNVFGFDYPPLHDPLAVAWVIDPTLFESKFMRVDIETSSDRCAGETICDIYDMSKDPKNVHVATKVDIARFWDLMVSAAQKANSVSSMNKLNKK